MWALPLGTNFSEILIEIQTFSLKKIHLKMSSAKSCSFRLGLNVLNVGMPSTPLVYKTSTMYINLQEAFQGTEPCIDVCHCLLRKFACKCWLLWIKPTNSCPNRIQALCTMYCEIESTWLRQLFVSLEFKHDVQCVGRFEALGLLWIHQCTHSLYTDPCSPFVLQSHNAHQIVLKCS